VLDLKKYSHRNAQKMKLAALTAILTSLWSISRHSSETSLKKNFTNSKNERIFGILVPHKRSLYGFLRHAGIGHCALALW
jgi:hypothetical protein